MSQRPLVFIIPILPTLSSVSLGRLCPPIVIRRTPCDFVGGDALIAPPFSHHIPGGAEPRPYTRLPIAFAPSVRADVGIRPYKITGGLCVIRTGGQSPRPYTRFPGGKIFPNQRPKAATYLCRFAAKARFDNRQPRRVFPKREGRSPPSLVVSRG